MRLVWTQEALDRLMDIQVYLTVEKQDPAMAEATLERLLQRGSTIQERPWSGRMVPDYEDRLIREQLENPYRLIYWVQSDVVYILTVLHQRQLLPKARELESIAQASIPD